jgi:hypothetical protein
MPEMENPKTSRSTAKGKLTRIEKYVNDDTIEKNINDLTIRLNALENIVKDFDKAQAGVESMPGIELADEEDERDSFEGRYFDVASKINTLIQKTQNKEQAITTGTSVRSVSNSNRDDSLNIQLPVYSLPTFSGCYKDWLSFSDQFKSVIHENDKLDSCKKFHYLRSCLKGEALKTVESLSVSNNNYQIAWDLLERRYANERLVAQEHVYAILKFPVIAKASHTHLRELIDMLNTNMEALKMLKVPVDSWDAIIVPIITEKLDFHSKREWQSKVDASIPKYKDFLLFLEKRHQTLESLFLTNKLVVTNVQPSKSKSNSYSSTSNNQSSNKSKFCNVCKKPNHYTNQCITLLKLDLNERLKLIQQLKLCQNCFKDNHIAVNCKSNFKCKECDASHNTLIHGATGLESSTARPQSVSLNSYSRVNLIKSGILSTAIVLIKDKNNQFQECRAFLDGGSMNHFITSDMCKRLGLTRQKVRIEIGGINQSASSVNHAARVTIKSRHNQYSQELRCLVLDKITENLPVHIMDMSKITVPENIKLADPRFDCSGPVDLLIGAELFLPLMCIGQIHLAPGQPHFQKTHLGWIVGGTLGELDNKTKTLCHFSQQKLDLHEQVEKFFSIESVNSVADKLSPEERECETHFCNTIKRDAQGRFIARLPFRSNPPDLGDSGAIKIHELQRAKITIIQLVQKQAFADDLKILRQNKALPNKSRLLTLSPFLSKNNLIRVGGRLRNASLKFDTKHPILLPNDHHVTKLIVEQTHIENLHSGAEGTLAALRQNYWIISPRSLIRQVIHRCNSCFRCNPKRVTQMMGDLPACRLESNRPFLISGVDYLGPILIKESTGRGKRNVKAYVSIFVCLVTKAVHLELVGNLTTESFLGALHRLIARRGHVRHLYSDNGSNFIGAANQETKKFKSFLKSSEFQSDVINKLTERNTEFHFIPARSPHMGGLWEINVKSVKNHIKRSIGLATPTFEEMYTLLTRIEAILNSRPLTPISNDPNDLEPLTPGHFLSPGESLTAVHEGDITEIKTNRLSRWQLIERMRQLFWRRWTREYLSRLQARSKWRNPDTTPAVGSLVLIADDDLPPLRWNLARITELHFGKDGLPRVASLKTKNGATKRFSAQTVCVTLRTRGRSRVDSLRVKNCKLLASFFFVYSCKSILIFFCTYLDLVLIFFRVRFMYYIY